MANPKLIPVPFANGGAKTTIPIARASNDPAEMPDYNEGFPPITSTPVIAGGKAPRRPDFNGILNDITANIRHLNSGGFFTFDAEFATKIGGYPKGAVLLSNDGSKKYVSLIDGNTSDFNTTLDPAKWAKAALTEREIQDIAWGAGQTSAPWAPLESPALTGIPTAPTAAVGTNTNQLATTAFVNAEIAADVANAVRSKIMITSNTIWTSPVTGTVYVSGCGGGGGGAGAYAAQQLSGGGGGGAGRSVMRQSITVAAGASYAVSIGSGGLAGGAGLVGGVGGNTTIGTLLTLEGGGGGAVGTGYNGGGGGSGYPGGGSGNGAYGGGEVGTGGMGASTIFGGGGGGGTSAKAVGQNAYGYGAGGGGGAGNSTAAGGAGAPGLIIIEFN